MIQNVGGYAQVPTRRTRGPARDEARRRSALLFKSRDSLRTCLEVEPEWSLDGNLAEAEVGGGEDAADDVLLLPALRNIPRLAVLVVAQDLQDVLRAVERDLA